jgi:hypothetical protein
MKIHIAGADSSNAVFAHENCRMRVMQQITSEMRQLQNDLSGDVGMPVRRNENSEARRSKESRYELPRCQCSPRPSHDSWVGRYPQKLIEYPPGRVPRHPVSPAVAQLYGYMASQLGDGRAVTLALMAATRSRLPTHARARDGLVSAGCGSREQAIVKGKHLRWR